MYAKTIALFGLASMANAHMKMNSPVPYGASSLNNSPLDASGSDFPCKQRAGVYETEGASNVYKLGSAGNELSFIGSAVHGGGSCQVSITYDAQPDKNSVWKVIKSIEGGCPAQDQAGNMGDNAAAEDPYKYSFDIPSDIPAGSGTIAWTWFNKIGNREMYMNCAPLTLEGSGGSQEAFNSLPDMFTANIGNGCGTEDSTDLQFPNPGNAVEQRNGATTAFAAPTGSCQAAGSSGGGSNNNDSPAPPATTAPPTPSQGTGNEGSASVSQPAQGGIFIPVPTTSSAPEPTPVAPAPDQGNENGGDAAPISTPTPTPDAGQDTPVTVSPPATGGSGAQSVGSACSNEGEWNCISGTSFQRCASGTWSAVQELAGGTSCQPGIGANINMIVTRNGRTRPLRFRSA